MGPHLPLYPPLGSVSSVQVASPAFKKLFKPFKPLIGDFHNVGICKLQRRVCKSQLLGFANPWTKGSCLEDMLLTSKKYNMQEKPHIPADVGTFGVRSVDAGKANL